MKFFYEPEKRKVKRVAIIASAVTLSLFLLYFFSGLQTGFVSLTEVGSDATKIEEKDVVLPAQEEIKIKETGKSNLPIYYEILKPTKINVRKISPAKIGLCPVYSNVIFEIENTGDFKAEAILLEVAGSAKIKDCDNCEVIEVLEAKEKKKVEIEACKENSSEMKTAIFVFSTVNAESFELRVN